MEKTGGGEASLLGAVRLNAIRRIKSRRMR
jgi:hypothetical protein